MSIHKFTPFLSDIKDFFLNSDMTAAMQNISSVLAQVKMTERDTLAVTSKRNCVYRLLSSCESWQKTQIAEVRSQAQMQLYRL